jgi:hypothetical protein
MISVNAAKALREAGLVWTPQNLDFFAIPMPEFEGQIFAINDMTILAEALYGEPAITFHGTVEWALDHLWLGDAVWLPREEQLRELLEERLLGQQQPALTLETSRYGYRCTINVGGEPVTFEDFDASEAYAAALLYALLN